jgi:hypothetical protein
MTSDGGGSVINVDELPSGENASTFAGHEHGAQVSFFLSNNRPGTGPKLHRHPYEETFIVEDGDVPSPSARTRSRRGRGHRRSRRGAT